MTFAMTLHSLAERHTPDSEFSHLDMLDRHGALRPREQADTLLCHLATQALSQGAYERSPVPSCILVNIRPFCASYEFRSPIVPIEYAVRRGATFHTDTQIRQLQEASTLHTVAYLADPTHSKALARSVQLVLYTHDESPLGDRDPMSLQWHIVSINAHITDGPAPQHPTSMARNQLEKVGGSKATYTSDDWAHSVWFWSTHCHIKPLPKQEGIKVA